MGAKEDAVALKDKGNKAFKEHNWDEAIDWYTKAIDTYDQEPAFFTNRAQVYIKTEAYGYAVADATKAIELDSNFVKVCLIDFPFCTFTRTDSMTSGILSTGLCKYRHSELQRCPWRLEDCGPEEPQRCRSA